jgi:hypothetical protein
MPGSRLVVQERDQRLLEALDQLVVVDREQAKVLGPFTSTPRANARLLALTRAGLLRRFFVSTGAFGRKAIYALPKTGTPRLIESRVAHQLALNQVYLWLKEQRSADVQLVSWRACTKAIGGLPLIPDAYVELAVGARLIPAFIEADCGTEPLSVWRKKAENYVALAASGAYRAAFAQDRFRVLVLAPTMRRAQSIKAGVAEITTKLFWISSFESINGVDVGASVWLRPGGAAPVPLLPSCATVDHAAGSAPVSRASAPPAAEATM